MMCVLVVRLYIVWFVCGVCDCWLGVGVAIIVSVDAVMCVL